jgi:hypothetical protein
VTGQTPAQTRPRGWWRRNVWGLILVLPLLAGLFAFNAGGFYRANYTLRPMEPVPVDGTGLARLDDYAIRLIEVAPVENPVDVKGLLGFGGRPLPASVKIWRVLLSIEAPKDSFVNLCKMSLEDAEGRLYAFGPSELHGGPVVDGCYPDNDDQPQPYTSTSIYLLPAESRPTAVRITWIDRLPRYVRFPVVP